jgi:hypothetical protein
MPLIDLPGAIGATYPGVASIVDGELTVNLIVEKVEGNGTSQLYFSQVPGLSTPVAVLGAVGGVQQGIYINGRRFWICNDRLWEQTGLQAPFGATDIGAVGPLLGGSLTFPVQYSMAINLRGNQLLIASNNVTSLYDLTTNTFTAAVTTPATFLVVDECDGYFIGLDASTGNFYISNFQDGLIWNALNFAFEGTPDLTTGFKVMSRRLYLWGMNHGEIYVDSGDATFPFVRDQSVYIECGAYPYSLAVADNSMFGIAVSNRGNGWAFRLNGVTPQRISTHGVEWAWSQYATISDATARTYGENGHEFVLWDFPTANASWCYDTSTGSWTQRGVYDQDQLTRDWGARVIFDRRLGQHFAGDYRYPFIYQQDLNYHNFNGTPRQWTRRFPHAQTDQTGMLYDMIRLIMQTGVNGSMGPAAPATIRLRISDDGGYTWFAVQPVNDAGRMGQFGLRVDWRHLGFSYDRMYELSGSDPMPLALVALKGLVRPCFT